MSHLARYWILVLLLCGCSAEPMRVDTFKVLGTATLEQIVAFDTAADTWCVVAGLCASRGDGDSTLEYVDTLPEGWNGAASKWYGGRTHIKIRDTLTGADLLNVAVHELGHHWGCPDVGEGEGVMHYRVQDTVRTLTDSDLACAR